MFLLLWRLPLPSSQMHFFLKKIKFRANVSSVCVRFLESQKKNRKMRLQQLYIQSYLWKWNLTASEVVLARTAKRIQYVDFRLLRLHLCYRRNCDPSFVSHPAKIQFGFLFISVSHIKRMRRKIEIKRAAAEAAIFIFFFAEGNSYCGLGSRSADFLLSYFSPRE